MGGGGGKGQLRSSRLNSPVRQKSNSDAKMIRSIFFGFMTGKPYTLHLKQHLKLQIPPIWKMAKISFQMIKK